MNKETQIQNKILICSECGSTNLFRDKNNGEVICTECGLVQSYKTVNGSLGLNVVQQSDGFNPLNLYLSDWGLSTKIDWKNRDYAGKGLPSQTREKVYRLRRWNRRIRINRSKERNLEDALSYMSHLCTELNLPKSVMITSSMVYRKALSKNLIRGKKIIDIVTASIYIGCRLCKVLRSFSELSLASNISQRKIVKYYRYIVGELDLEIESFPKSYYINRITSQLGLLGPVEDIALLLIESAYRNRLVLGCSPSGVAAACIYISSKFFNVGLIQETVAEKANITEVTLRNRYKSLLSNIVIEVYV